MSLKQPLHLHRLRWPRPHELLLWTKGTLLGVVLPVWLALSLAVTPQRLDEVMLDGRAIAAMQIGRTDVEALKATFDRHDFDLKALTAGRRDTVPPIFVRALPRGWDELRRVEVRKALFVKSVLPLILRENARIRADRAELLQLETDSGGDPARLSKRARRWLAGLAERYGLDEPDFAALKRRVDVVPVDLALAQAANESGWGTSRFARKGNALFGQWVWDSEAGMEPREARSELGDYGVRRFKTLGHSVAAYMHNLNTHPAYADLRRLRAKARARGAALDGVALAAGLERYSERGEVYISELRAMIRHNAFQRLRRTRLAPTPTS